MSTKGEGYPLTSKSDPCPETHRSGSPIWISKLLGSVWKMDSTNPMDYDPDADVVQGQTRPQQRVWEADGFTSAEDDFGKTVEKFAHNWHPEATRQNNVTQFTPHHVSGGDPSRGRFQSMAPSSGQPSIGRESSQKFDARGKPISLPLGLPGPMSQDMARQPNGAYFIEERDRNVGRSPNMHRTRCESSSYSSPEPNAFYHAAMKLDGYSGSFGAFPNGNTTSAALAPSPDTHVHSNFQSQSPFCTSLDNSHYTKSNFQNIDFACHTQTQQTHQPFSYQHHRPQPGLSSYPNGSLYTNSSVEFSKPRDASQPMQTSRPNKNFQRNSLPYNEPFSGRVTHDKAYPSSPQPFESAYRNGRDVAPRYVNYAQPELGKPKVSRVYDDATSTRRSKTLAYFPETHHAQHERYSPRYERLSPVSPSASQSCSLPPLIGQHLGHSSDDSVGLSQSPSSNLPYNPPIKPVNNCHPLEAATNGFSTHPQRHRRQHSPDATQKSAKQPRGAQNLPPCRVCGNKASGLHFGVNTCEACNEFFRRSLKRGANYHCSRNLSCKVWGKKRSPCSSCRYRRCLEVGMSRNRIKTGRYSHRTRAEYAQEIERNKRNETYEQERERVLSMLTTLVESHDRYIRNSSHIPQEDILRTQEKFLADFSKHKERRKMRRKKTKCGSHKGDDLSDDEPDFRSSTSNTETLEKRNTSKTSFTNNVGSEGSIEKDSESQNMDANESKSTCFSALIPDMLDSKGAALPGETSNEASFATNSNDHDTLNFMNSSLTPHSVSRPEEFENNADTKTGLTNHLHPDPGLDPNTGGLGGAGVGDGDNSEGTDSDNSTYSDCMGLTQLDAEITERWLRSYITYAKLIPGFKHLPISDQANLVRLSWFEFWFLGAYRGFNSELKVVMYPIGHTLHESQFMKIFGEDFCYVSFHLADRMRTLRLSAEEMVLMKTVCLLAPDRCELKDRDAVEKMYWAMVSALLHVLEKNRPNDRMIFPKIIGKMVELRTMSAIAMKAHSGALFPDVLPQRPLLGEMVVGNK
ncbi:E75 nuclear receptor [Elysia marginata]|uniref:E75 nuclear receptor n=1 Tax=Elysia marginata TaxID=1093978 RepID=A0AAV4GZ25_9GAST|nr:E75 nuclear receptor [Elysia marginata]